MHEKYIYKFVSCCLLRSGKFMEMNSIFDDKRYNICLYKPVKLGIKWQNQHFD